MTNRATVLDGFLEAHGWGQAQRQYLAGDASNRRYERLRQADGHHAVLMDAPPEKGEDTRPFIRVAQYLQGVGLSAPQIFAADEAQGFLLIEDLGDAVFAGLMENDPSSQRHLYHAAADALLHLRNASPLALPLCDADWLVEMTTPAFDWYAPQSDISTFMDAFTPLAKALDKGPKGVILRDFHAENLIWLPDRTGVQRVGLLDFQDALLGHPAYDLVSVLQDARRDVPVEIETEILGYFIAQLDADPSQFRAAYALLGVQRNLRILGIFARLCKRDGKASYVALIPRVWGYLQRNLQDTALQGLATTLVPLLPTPTPEFLESLRSQCATHLTQP